MIKKVILISVLIFSFFLIGCNSSNNLEELNRNDTFNSIFSKAELEEIALILDFFESKICLGKNETSKTKCYKKFLEIKHERIEKGKSFSIFPIKDQIEMYKSVSDSVYQLFWASEIIVFEKSSDTLEMNNIMLNGKYNDFLKELGNEDILIKRYSERLEQIGDISALIGPMTYKENIFNLKDIRIRFFIAIHYLSCM